MSSTLEREFVTIWRVLNGPELEPEYRFHPSRKWRFDFAAPAQLVGIELEGGTWAGGRHTSGKGYAADCAKYNAAALAGWRVFRLTGDMLRDNPMEHLLPVVALLREA
jgi:very-short-patch-repair endonuclease